MAGIPTTSVVVDAISLVVGVTGLRGTSWRVFTLITLLSELRGFKLASFVTVTDILYSVFGLRFVKLYVVREIEISPDA